MKKKILAFIEVSTVFCLLVVLFRVVQSNPLSKNINETLNGYLFSEYAILMIVVLALYLFCSRSESKILRSEKIRFQAQIIGRGFFPIFTLSVLLSWINWRDWGGAFLISVIEIGLLAWFAWLVRNTQPPWQKVGVSSSLLLYPIMMHHSERVTDILVAIVYFYLFVAVSEETLFRGYIQTRLNTVFGSSKRLFGIPWGWGLVVSAVYFGIWHLGLGTGSLNWPHVIWTLFAGLIFGIVREKSESVIAPIILHGIMNYGPQAILFYLFWGQ